MKLLTLIKSILLAAATLTLVSGVAYNEYANKELARVSKEYAAKEQKLAERVEESKEGPRGLPVAGETPVAQTPTDPQPIPSNTPPSTSPQTPQSPSTSTLSEARVRNIILGYLSTSEIQDSFRGATGPQGEQGIQGPAGTPGTSGTSPAPIFYYPPNPQTGSSGGSLFSATDLSSTRFVTTQATISDTLTTQTLSVLGNSTLAGTLNVTGTITGSVNPGFTLGSVVFQGASGLAQDNSNFFWDDTNNRVGIGTAVPTYALDVLSAGGEARLVRSINTNGGDVGRLLLGGYNSSNANFNYGMIAANIVSNTAGTESGALRFYTANAGSGANAVANPAMTILNTGNIGIGTTNPTAAKLQVAGAVAVTGGAATAVAATTNLEYSSGGSIRVFGPDATTVGTLRLTVAESDGGGGIDAVSIANTGNVGIGTTNPTTAKLVVASDWDSGITNNSQLYLQGVTNSNKQLRIGFDTTSNFGYIQALVSGTGTNNLALNPSGGNVGIGTVLPTGKLDVKDGNFVLTDIDVAHGMTGYGDTSMYAFMQPLSPTAGGLYQVGISDTDAGGLFLAGTIGAVDPTDTIPAVRFNASKKNTTTDQALGSLETAFQFYNYTTHLATILGNGNLGIGVINPASKLTVQGDIRINAGSGGQIIFADGSTMASAALGSAAALSNITDAIVTADSDANGTGDVILKTASADRLHILNNGNVGIGIANPGYKLEVIDNIGITASEAAGTNPTLVIRDNSTAQSRVSALNFVSSTGSAQGQISYIQSTNTMGFNTNTARAMTILSSSNVGIGTTAPIAKLNISDAAYDYTKGLYIGTANAGVGLSLWYDNAADTTAYIDSRYDVAGAAMKFRLRAAGTPVTAMTILGSGNVGIGTPTPGGVGDGGSPIILQTHGGSGYGLNILSTSATADGSNVGIITFASTGLSGADKRTAIIRSYKNDALTVNPVGSLAFETANGGAPTEKMRILANGNVGIGTTGPSDKLTLNGTSLYSLNFENSGVIKGQIGSVFSANQMISGSAAGDLAIRNRSNNILFAVKADDSASLYLQGSSGNVGIGTTGPGTKLTVLGGDITLRETDDGNSAAYIGANATRGFIQLSENGSPKVEFNGQATAASYINNGGNFGIGTAVPNSQLAFGLGQDQSSVKTYNVDGQAGIDFYRLNTGNLERYLDIAAVASGNGASAGGSNIRFLTHSTSATVSATERMRIDRDGNVGIGRTNPGFILDVTDPTTGSVGPRGIRVTSNSNTVGPMIRLDYGLGTATNWALGTTWEQASDFVIRSSNVVGGDPGNAGKTRFSILNSGRVGINTTLPTSSLQIGVDDAAAVDPTFDLRVTRYAAGAFTGSYRNEIRTSANPSQPHGTLLHAAENDATRSVVDITSAVGTIASFRSTGNVGIGTTGPAEKLDVSVTSGTPRIQISNRAFGNNGYISFLGTVQPGSNNNEQLKWELGMRQIDSSNTSFVVKDLKAGADRFFINSSGSIQFVAYGAGTLVTDASGNITASSDERLKIIQGSMNRGLADVLGINPVAYKWNAESGMEMEGVYAGFSAQNIQAHIPEATGIDSRGYLTLSDRPILAAAINAIKELNQKLEVVSGSSGTATLTVTDNLEVNIKLTVKGHTYLSEDSIGQAKVLAGSTSVRINFSAPYEYQPIVTLTAAGPYTSRFWVSNTDASGFTVTLEQAESQETIFNWHAFAGSSAKLTVSDGSSQSIILITPQPTSQPEPTTTTEPTASETTGPDPTSETTPSDPAIEGPTTSDASTAEPAI